MLGKKFEDFDVFTGCDRHRLSEAKIEPEIEGSVRLHWPLITPKRLLTDFEKITIRKEAKPIIVKMNAFRHLEADQSSHLSFLIIERVREALVVKMRAPFHSIGRPAAISRPRGNTMLAGPEITGSQPGSGPVPTDSTNDFLPFDAGPDPNPMTRKLGHHLDYLGQAQ